MKTKTSTYQDVKYTLQCITKGNIIMKTFKHTPITNDDTDYFALSLIDFIVVTEVLTKKSSMLTGELNLAAEFVGMT